MADLCAFDSIPTAKIFSRVMDEDRMGIEPFRELFYDLSETSRSLGLWKGRLVGAENNDYSVERGIEAYIQAYLTKHLEGIY